MCSVCISYSKLRFGFIQETKCVKQKQLKKLLIFVKYEYGAKFGPCEEVYDMTIDSETTIKDAKNKFNEPFISGELDMNQYFSYKHGEQHVRSEPTVAYYKYTEPDLLDDDKKSLQYLEYTW